MSDFTLAPWLEDSAFILHVACAKQVWQRVYSGQATGEENARALRLFAQDVSLLRALCAGHRQALTADVMRAFVYIDAERCGLSRCEIDPALLRTVLRLAGFTDDA